MTKDKRILVSGGGGSIGSELVRQLAPNNKIYILDINETAAFDLSEELKLKGYWVECRVGDIRDRETIRDVFSDFKPQYIFHAAALKHVTPGEQSPLEYIKTNVLGTHNLLDFAKRWECVEKFVFISTDKVVNSSSVMGTTKKLAEIMVKNSGYTAVRFGNVLGSRGSVIPLWQGQIDRGESLTVTDDRMKRYFMTIQEACELVIKAAEASKGGEIMILDMGEQVNILNLAKEVLNKSDRKVAIKMIGIRPGETLQEQLMTAEEKERAVKKGKFWIIK
jgi:FlaA1/EpsC-like NDP-sugar epimerase